MTVAASATEGRTTVGHLSWRVVIRRRSLSRPNMISIRLRRFSCLMGLPRDFLPQARGDQI